MALDQASLLSNAWNDPQLPRARSLLFRPGSTPIGSGVVEPDGSLPSPLKYALSMDGADRTTERSRAACHPSASAPTSTPSGSPCNRFEVFASSATLLCSDCSAHSV